MSHDPMHQPQRFIVASSEVRKYIWRNREVWELGLYFNVENLILVIILPLIVAIKLSVCLLKCVILLLSVLFMEGKIHSPIVIIDQWKMIIHDGQQGHASTPMFYSGIYLSVPFYY